MKRPGDRIYEGEDAVAGQFPYHAYYEDGPYICGASIIEPVSFDIPN